MGEVIAGFAAGYTMAILTTIAFVYLLVRGFGSSLVSRYAGGDMNPLVLSVPISIGAFLAWSMLGLLLGSAYRVGGLEDETNALGSPSAPFLVAMVAIGAMPVPLLLIFWPRLWWLWCGMALAFVGLFGWFMPLMAAEF